MSEMQAITVLLIDDNPVDRQIYRRMLEALTYIVHEAEDGATGLEAARLLQPDCVLLDLRLTDQSGFEVLLALVKEPEHPALPVVMFTGATEQILEEGARNLGAHSCLIKGRCGASDLDRAIREAVAHHAVPWSPQR